MSNAPPLPDFIARRLPYDRRTHDLTEGLDAGRTIHLIDHGPRDRRPVLLMHGNPTWSFLWRKVIADLLRDEDGGEFRCVAPDLLGLGLSSKLPRMADHDIDRHADAIAEVVEALDLRGIVLAVQDWGGPIGTAVAARLPERFAGLVIANTAVVLPREIRGSAFHRFARRPIAAGFAFRVLGYPQRALHKAQGDPASIQGDVARAYRWPLRRFRDRIAPLAMARMVPDSSAHPSYAQIERGARWATRFGGPVRLVWGTRDPVLGRALKRHEEAFPNAPVERTEAGHFLQEEVPDVLADAIRGVAADLAP